MPYDITVTASRTIPVKPYGNEKWEFTLTSEFDDDIPWSQALYELTEVLRERLDVEEGLAFENANSAPNK